MLLLRWPTYKTKADAFILFSAFFCYYNNVLPLTTINYDRTYHVDEVCGWFWWNSCEYHNVARACLCLLLKCQPFCFEIYMWLGHFSAILRITLRRSWRNSIIMYVFSGQKWSYKTYYRQRHPVTSFRNCWHKC